MQGDPAPPSSCGARRRRGSRVDAGPRRTVARPAPPVWAASLAWRLPSAGAPSPPPPPGPSVRRWYAACMRATPPAVKRMRRGRSVTHCRRSESRGPPCRGARRAASLVRGVRSSCAAGDVLHVDTVEPSDGAAVAALWDAKCRRAPSFCRGKLNAGNRRRRHRARREPTPVRSVAGRYRRGLATMAPGISARHTSPVFHRRQRHQRSCFPDAQLVGRIAPHRRRHVVRYRRRRRRRGRGGRLTSSEHHLDAAAAWRAARPGSRLWSP